MAAGWPLSGRWMRSDVVFGRRPVVAADSWASVQAAAGPLGFGRVTGGRAWRPGSRCRAAGCGPTWCSVGGRWSGRAGGRSERGRTPVAGQELSRVAVVVSGSLWRA
ncbi:hypothetical protein GCM10009830_03950 [Glycomyces endophyticus]|uniref:Uncharacterized protein n=1 Tax=Glycomyces endophyticus TaxID=480996 RepID=A0ABP4RZH4_9ACTN